MNPPSAGLDRPAAVTCYTDEDLTSAAQRPYGRGNGVVVAAAAHPAAHLSPIAGFPAR
jgi:hypothetical protein